MSYRLVYNSKVNSRFGRKFHLSFHLRRILLSRGQQNSLCLLLASFWLLAWLILRSWKLNGVLLRNGLNGVIRFSSSFLGMVSELRSPTALNPPKKFSIFDMLANVLLVSHRNAFDLSSYNIVF